MGCICIKSRAQKNKKSRIQEGEIRLGQKKNKQKEDNKSETRLQIKQQEILQHEKHVENDINLEQLRLKVQMQQKMAEQTITEFYNLIKTNGNAELELKNKREQNQQLKRRIKQYQKNIADLKETERKQTFKEIEAPNNIIKIDEQINLIKQEIQKEREQNKQSNRLRQLLHFYAIKQKDRGHYKKALIILNEQFPLCLQFCGDGSNDHGEIVYQLAENHLYLKQYKNALNYYQEAFKIFHLIARQSNQIARVLNGLGLVVYYGKKQTSEALNYFNQALNMNKNLYGNNHEDVAKNLYSIAIIFKQLKQYTTAIQTYTDVLQIYKNLHGQCHIETALVYFNLADCQFELYNYDKGIDNIYQFFTIMKALKALNQPRHIHSINYLKTLVKRLLKTSSIEENVMQRFVKMMEQIFINEYEDNEINRLIQIIIKKYS